MAKFSRQAQVGQIAGNRNMIGPGIRQVVLQSREYAVAVLGAAVQSPFQIPENSFAQKFPQLDIGNTGYMRIGNVGQRKGCAAGRVSGYVIRLERYRNHR